jgi:amino acid permease
MSEEKNGTRVSDNSDVILPFRKSDETLKNEYTATEHMVLDTAFQADEDHALTVFGGILTIISTILGGGIVGLPYGFYQLGMFPGAIFMITMGLLTINSSWLYIKSKDLIPGKPESLYEIGYMLFKRSSIFIISACLAINSLGLCMVYFIIFGKTSGSIVYSLFIKDDTHNDLE